MVWEWLRVAKDMSQSKPHVAHIVLRVLALSASVLCYVAQSMIEELLVRTLLMFKEPR